MRHAALVGYVALTVWTVGCVSLGGLSAGEPSADGGAPTTGDADHTDGSATADGTSVDATLPDGTGTGGDADSSAECPRAVCPTVLTAAVGPQRLALVDNAVYWTSSAAVGRVRLDGSSATTTTLSAVTPPLARDVAVGTMGVPYVTVPTRGAAACAADLTTCGTGFIGSAGSASSVAVDAANVYIGIFDDGAGAGAGALFRTGLDGSSPLVYANVNDAILGLQVVAGTAFYRTSSAIRSVTSPSSLPMVVTAGQPLVAFVVQGNTLVVATATNELRVCTLAGTVCASPTSPVLVTTSAASAMTADGTRVYWVEGGVAGSVRACDLPLCANPTLLAEGQAFPSDIAVDALSIYWTNQGNAAGVGGAVMKLPK